MYEESYKAGVTSMKLQAKVVGGAVRKTIETTLEMPFTESIARELNQEGTREKLKDFSLEQAKPSMTAFNARARFYNGSDQRTLDVRGKTATCNCPKDDGEEPMIKIPVVSQYNEEDLVYLARALANQVTVRFTKRQLSLVEDDDDNEGEAAASE
jgi:hypothetical protein